jgi:hypothetical protein
MHSNDTRYYHHVKQETMFKSSGSINPTNVIICFKLWLLSGLGGNPITILLSIVDRDPSNSAGPGFQWRTEYSLLYWGFSYFHVPSMLVSETVYGRFFMIFLSCFALDHLITWLYKDYVIDITLLSTRGKKSSHKLTWQAKSFVHLLFRRFSSRQNSIKLFVNDL